MGRKGRVPGFYGETVGFCGRIDGWSQEGRKAANQSRECPDNTVRHPKSERIAASSPYIKFLDIEEFCFVSVWARMLGKTNHLQDFSPKRSAVFEKGKEEGNGWNSK